MQEKYGAEKNDELFSYVLGLFLLCLQAFFCKLISPFFKAVHVG